MHARVRVDGKVITLINHSIIRVYTVQSVELASTFLFAKNKMLYAKLELSVAAKVTNKELSRATRSHCPDPS